MANTGELLLDTHALLWWLSTNRRLSVDTRHRLDDAETQLLVSAITCWEVAMLVAKGRIELDRPVAAWANDLSRAPRIRIEPVRASVAVAAASLVADGFHGDPADGILLATARHLAVPLVTADEAILSFAPTDTLRA